MIAYICLALAIAYAIVSVAKFVRRNRKAHQFFQTRSPNLPVLPKCTLYSGHALNTIIRDKNWRELMRHHKVHGPTYGMYYFGQPWLATKDLDLLKVIEIDEGHIHTDRCLFGLPIREFNNSIFQKNGDDWRRARRAVAPALTNMRVRSEEISSDIELVLSRLAESLETKMSRAEKLFGVRSFVMNVHDTCLRYSLAVILLVTYKQELVDFNARVDEWTSLMQQGAKDVFNPLITLASLMPILEPLCLFIARFLPVGKAKSRLVSCIAAATDLNRLARKSHNSNGHDADGDFSKVTNSGKFKRRMVDTIIDAFLEKRLSYDEFIGTTFFMLLAGFQTTADTISCLIWQLAQHPDIQEKLRDTIMREGIDAEYVRWCIMETIRWLPAVPLGAGRVLARDVTVKGTFLPKGTFVMPSTYAIHHDPNIWPEPDEFKPDRWSEQASFHPAAFMGFGLGPRNCVGGKLAMHEIKLVMQMFLAKYRFEKCPETPDEYRFSSPGLIYTLADDLIKVRLVEL